LKGTPSFFGGCKDIVFLEFVVMYLEKNRKR